MKQPPYYKAHPEPGVPVKRRWVMVLPFMIAVGALATVQLWPAGKSARGLEFWLYSIVAAPGLWVMAFAFRQWWFFTARSNKAGYDRMVELRQQAWWITRSKPVYLQALALVGPFGDTADKLRALAMGTATAARETTQSIDGAKPGDPKQTVKVMRWQQALMDTEATRQKRLARALARQLVQTLKAQDPELKNIAVSQVYWYGGDAAWAVFRDGLADLHIKLPDTPLLWSGMATLDQVFDQLHSRELPVKRILCAGVSSPPAIADQPLPAGEAAFAWLLGQEKGDICLHRPENVNAAAGEVLAAACAQVASYADRGKPPEQAVVLDKDAVEPLQAAQWTAMNFVQAPYFGDPGALAAPAMLTVAALVARQQHSACGWMAADTSGMPVVGVIVPNESAAQT